MIKAKEYRIGNWVSNGEVEVQLTSKDIYHLDIYVNRVIAKPIPITPEWLERMGFEKIEYDTNTFYSMYFIGDLELLNGDKNGFYEVCLAPYEDYFRYRYVHQVQNLVFALTGEEI